MSFSEFIRLVRPRTLTAAISPVFLGLCFAFYYYAPAQSPLMTGITEFLLFAAAIMAQMASNIWNEYYDYKSGLDEHQKVGNSGSITRNNMSPIAVKRWGFYMIYGAIASGFLLAFLTSLWLIPIGLLCMTIAFAYSGGPYPISRTPFGELASGIAMGLTIVLVAAYVWSGFIQWPMLIPAIPSMILIGLILQSNSTRDIENDRSHGRRTFAIIVGKDHSIQIMASLYIFVQIWLLTWILLGYLPFTASLGFLSIIPAAKSIRLFWQYADVYSLDHAMKFSAITNTAYHFLIAIGLLIAKV